jgi:hypothetical protein
VHHRVHRVVGGVHRVLAFCALARALSWLSDIAQDWKLPCMHADYGHALHAKEEEIEKSNGKSDFRGLWLEAGQW